MYIFNKLKLYIYYRDATRLALERKLHLKEQDRLKKYKAASKIQARIRGIISRKLFKKSIPNLKKQQQVRRFCIECEVKVATKRCIQCKDRYCDICYNTLHRKGNRRAHTFDLIGNILGLKDLEEPKKETGKLIGGVQAALERAKATTTKLDMSHWQEFFDAQAKAKYWYNTITGEATWVNPIN